VTVTEALMGLCVIALAGVPLLTGQAESTRRLSEDRVRDAAESVMDAVMRRFARPQDGVRAFLAASPGGRLAGHAPWRWSPELTAGLDVKALDAWAAQRGFEVAVSLSPGDAPGLTALELTATWRDGDRVHRLHRVRLYPEDARG